LIEKPLSAKDKGFLKKYGTGSAKTSTKAV
jgi:hypothetical protein